LDQCELLQENGIIMAEHAVDVVLPETVGRLMRRKHEEYGSTAVSIYEYE